MKKDTASLTDIDEYIGRYPADVQKLLKQIRAAIKKTAPAAGEKIAYGIPTFELNGNLVHFGGFKNHIGFYPAPSGIEAFKERLTLYGGAKGTVKFPLDQPLPLDLITDIVTHRVGVNMEKAAGKSVKKTK